MDRITYVTNLPISAYHTFFQWSQTLDAIKIDLIFRIGNKKWIAYQKQSESKSNIFRL